MVWPEGHAVRRLRGLAIVGIALIGLGTIAQLALVLGAGGSPDESGAGDSVPWLLARLAALALAGFFGAELLQGPLRGGRRITAVAIVAALTATVLAAPPAMVSPTAPLAPAEAAYLVAPAIWLGSLVALAALLVPRDRPDGLEGVWNRFSWFAGISVLVLALTGAVHHLAAGRDSQLRSGVLLPLEVYVLAATFALSRYAVGYGRRLAFRRAVPARAARRAGWRATTTGRCHQPPVGARCRPAGDGGGAACRRSGGQRPRVCPRGRRWCRPARPGHRRRWQPPAKARPADPGRTRFVPARIVLPGGSSAEVVPVATVGRELVVPEDPGVVGWWDGSSYVGDPYGSTVIAGHVDTLDHGLGFFFKLWHIKVGERVVLGAGDDRQAYEITSLREVPRTDLVDDGEAFDIDGPPRLVLITCAGDFRPGQGGYSRNLVVVARPVA